MTIVLTITIGADWAVARPTRIKQKSPSYWHGWSPDGKTLAFVGERGGEFDSTRFPPLVGEETRLTTAKGLDDGPEYSPGAAISTSTPCARGRMQIWRMKPVWQRAGADHVRRLQ